ALAYGAAGIAMGTRFMLTSDSPVADAAKQRYLNASVDDTVRTRAVDGLPQRVLRNRLVDALERSGRAALMARALRSGLAYRQLSGQSVPDLLRSASTLRSAGKLTRAQTLMAANAPVLVREGLVAGKAEEGVLPTGQVAGLIDDLPSCADLIDSIATSAAARLARLGA
ncbi:MAG TPA: nitronate monooxygenase, partial [Conexibacter sp.]